MKIVKINIVLKNGASDPGPHFVVWMFLWRQWH